MRKARQRVLRQRGAGRRLAWLALAVGAVEVPARERLHAPQPADERLVGIGQFFD